MQRRFAIHEAESGGIDAVSMMVETDASSIAEVFAASASDIDFYVVGYWDTPPGTYTEAGGVHGQVSASSTWEEAEAGGSDNGTVHVNVDGSTRIDWYSEAGAAERYFYPVGWWVVAP